MTTEPVPVSNFAPAWSKVGGVVLYSAHVLRRLDRFSAVYARQPDFCEKVHLFFHHGTKSAFVKGHERRKLSPYGLVIMGQYP